MITPKSSLESFEKGINKRTACRSLNLKPYVTISCNVTVHDENAVGLVETW